MLRSCRLVLMARLVRLRLRVQWPRSLPLAQLPLLPQSVPSLLLGQPRLPDHLGRTDPLRLPRR